MMMNTVKNSCAVIIPIYKSDISNLEAISLRQAQKVLSNHDIIIIKPKDLILDNYNSQFFGVKNIVSFDNHYFKDISGYNELMMSASFYASFLGYTFILIHQLDAFVFKDDLNYWCSTDYDYIGAPWLREKIFPSKFKVLKENIRSFFHRRYNFLGKDGLPDAERQLSNRVGNGGLSLRRVGVFHTACKNHQAIINKYLQKSTSHYNEDIFWSIELNRKKRNIKIPNVKTAIHFSIETMPSRAIDMLNKELPFGCHAWDKNLEFWTPIFEKQGYDIKA